MINKTKAKQLQTPGTQHHHVMMTKSPYDAALQLNLKQSITTEDRCFKENLL